MRLGRAFGKGRRLALLAALQFFDLGFFLFQFDAKALNLLAQAFVFRF